MSKFAAALAAAKPSDAIKLPDDKYRVKVVSATYKGGENNIIRLDLETIQGAQTGVKFAGRRQIKNQPITEKSAGYVAALLTQCGMQDVLASSALAEALERGDEATLRRMVGAELTIQRTTEKNTGDVQMEIVVVITE